MRSPAVGSGSGASPGWEQTLLAHNASCSRATRVTWLPAGGNPLMVHRFSFLGREQCRNLVPSVHGQPALQVSHLEPILKNRNR